MAALLDCRLLSNGDLACAFLENPSRSERGEGKREGSWGSSLATCGYLSIPTGERRGPAEGAVSVPRLGNVRARSRAESRFYASASK